MKTDNNRVASMFLKVLKTPTTKNNLNYNFLDVVWSNDRFIFTIDITSSEDSFSYVKDSISQNISDIIHSKLSQYFDMKLVCTYKITVNGEKILPVYINQKDRKNILDHINKNYNNFRLILPDYGEVIFDSSFEWSHERYYMEIDYNLVFSFKMKIFNLSSSAVKTFSNSQKREMEHDITSIFFDKSFNNDLGDICYEIVGKKLFGDNDDGDFMISSLIDLEIV